MLIMAEHPNGLCNPIRQVPKRWFKACPIVSGAACRCLFARSFWKSEPLQLTLATNYRKNVYENRSNCDWCSQSSHAE